MEDFSYRNTAGMTMAYAIVKSYPTFTEMALTKKETEFLKTLLEENVDENGTIVKVLTKIFKQIWEGTELSIHKLDCGRFNINNIIVDGEEESLKEKSSFFNIQR